MSNLKNSYLLLRNAFLKSILLVIKTRDFVFKRGTDTMQVFNIAICFSFFYVFQILNKGFEVSVVYKNTMALEDSFLWLLMGVIGLLQLVFLIVKSMRCKILAGFILLASTPIYGFISIYLSYGNDINVGSLLSGMFAFMCFMSGWRLMDLYDHKLNYKEKANAGVNAKNKVKKVGTSDVAKFNFRTEYSNHATVNTSDDRGIFGSLHDSTSKIKD